MKTQDARLNLNFGKQYLVCLVLSMSRLYFYLAILFNGDICGKLSQGTLGVDGWGGRWCRGAGVH